MDGGQIILFQTQGGETKIEVRCAQYQLSPVEIHFIEAFEAEQKKLRGKG